MSFWQAPRKRPLPVLRRARDSSRCSMSAFFWLESPRFFQSILGGIHSRSSMLLDHHAGGPGPVLSDSRTRDRPLEITERRVMQDNDARVLLQIQNSREACILMERLEKEQGGECESLRL